MILVMEDITFQIVINLWYIENRCCCQNKDNCDSLLGFFFIDLSEGLATTGTESIENKADSS